MENNFLKIHLHFGKKQNEFAIINAYTMEEVTAILSRLAPNLRLRQAANVYGEKVTIYAHDHISHHPKVYHSAAVYHGKGTASPDAHIVANNLNVNKK